MEILAFYLLPWKLWIYSHGNFEKKTVTMETHKITPPFKHTSPWPTTFTLLYNTKIFRLTFKSGFSMTTPLPTLLAKWSTQHPILHTLPLSQFLSNHGDNSFFYGRILGHRPRSDPPRNAHHFWSQSSHFAYRFRSGIISRGEFFSVSIVISIVINRVSI